VKVCGRGKFDYVFLIIPQNSKTAYEKKNTTEIVDHWVPDF